MNDHLRFPSLVSRNSWFPAYSHLIGEYRPAFSLAGSSWYATFGVSRSNIPGLQGLTAALYAKFRRNLARHNTINRVEIAGNVPATPTHTLPRPRFLGLWRAMGVRDTGSRQCPVLLLLVHFNTCTRSSGRGRHAACTSIWSSRVLATLVWTARHLCERGSTWWPVRDASTIDP